MIRFTVLKTYRDTEGKEIMFSHIESGVWWVVHGLNELSRPVGSDHYFLSKRLWKHDKYTVSSTPSRSFYPYFSRATTVLPTSFLPILYHRHTRLFLTVGEDKDRATGVRETFQSSFESTDWRQMTTRSGPVVCLTSCLPEGNTTGEDSTEDQEHVRSDRDWGPGNTSKHGDLPCGWEREPSTHRTTVVSPRRDNGGRVRRKRYKRFYLRVRY